MQEVDAARCAPCANRPSERACRPADNLADPCACCTPVRLVAAYQVAVQRISEERADRRGNPKQREQCLMQRVEGSVPFALWSIRGKLITCATEVPGRELVNPLFKATNRSVRVVGAQRGFDAGGEFG